jgi:hypothetical protein
MDKLPTADELIYNHYSKIYDDMPNTFKKFITLEKYIDLHWCGQINGKEKSNKQLMLEFATMHVKAALKEASNKAKANVSYDDFDGTRDAIVVKSTILNAYPLENIK